MRARQAASARRALSVRARFQPNKHFDYDLVVVGGGSGGVAAARRAGAHGARVAIVEKHRLGGTCVNYGCVPKKLFFYAAQFRSEIQDARGYGWQIPEPRFDWRALKHAKNEEIARLNGIYARLLANAGVEMVKGAARLEDAHTVVVDGQRKLRAENILLATGGRAWLPDEGVEGIEHALTSQHVLEFEDEHFAELPRSIAIVGSGYIGCEFASIFHEFGVRTTLLARGTHVLSGFDHDVRAAVTENLMVTGVDLRRSTILDSISKQSDGAFALRGSGGFNLTVDKVIFAIGRIPLSRGLGLEEVGVQLDAKGAVVVNEFSRTSVPNIYAVGDLTNRVNLTPVAIAEGRAFAETLFNSSPTAVDHSVVASAVFTQPEAASVGLSEAKAATRLDGQIKVFRTRFNPMRNAMAKRSQKTMMKVVVAAATDRVLGFHMVGPGASEQVQCLAAAVSAGVTKHQLDRTLALHPTAAEEWVLLREPVPLSFHAFS